MSKSFLIAGGGSGIGAACAVELAAAGHRVMITGRRESALRAVADLSGCGWVVADCSEEEGARHAVGSTVESHGGLDALVCCAGTMLTASLLETGADDWDAVMRNNVGVAFHVARAALPELLQSKGSLTFVASIAALRSSPNSAAYAASKAAVVALAQNIAVEHGRRGVRSNVICPGWVRTEMADAEVAELDSDLDRAYAEVTAVVPQGRAAEPSEIAAAVSWLSSPAASYVNGSTLVVDGGTTLVDAGTLPFDHHIRARAHG